MISVVLSVTPFILQSGSAEAVTPATVAVVVLLLPLLLGLFIVLILREKVKDRRKQVPPLPPSYYRQAPPLPSKRSGKGPPDLPRGY